MAAIEPLRVILLAGAALASAVPMAATAAPGEVGIASAVINSVSVRNGGAAQAHAARVRERLSLADQVSTGAASRLQVLLLDRSVFTVGANARLTIDRFVYDPGGSSVSASVAKGAFRFLSGGAGHRGGGSSIKTPVATIGIRGTIVDGTVGPEAVEIARGEGQIARGMTVDPQTATLVVLRGPGARTGGKVGVGAISVTAGGQTVDCDRPLMAVFVPAPGAAPIGPFTISLPGLARLSDLIVPSGEPVLSGEGGGYYPAPAPTSRSPRGYGRYPGGPDGPYDRGEPAPGGQYIPNLPSFPQDGGARRPPPRQTGTVRETPAPAATGQSQPTQMQPSPQPTPAPSPAREPAPAPTPAPEPTSNFEPTPTPAPTSNFDPAPTPEPANFEPVPTQTQEPPQEPPASLASTPASSPTAAPAQDPPPPPPSRLKSQSISSTPGKP